MERNEAIEVVKRNYPHVTESGSQFETALRTLIPELAESDDEKIRNQIINFIEEYGNPIHCEWQKDWIAWLEKQYTWKPSNEQMKALHDLNLTGNVSYAGQGQTLIELYNDLKKLKGE